MAPALEVILPRAVNDLCPLEGGVAVDAYVEEYCGQVIGFCSEECLTEWQKMNNAEQQTKLIRESMKRSGRTWSPKQ